MANEYTKFNAGTPDNETVADTSTLIVTGNDLVKFVFLRNESTTTALWLSVGVAAERNKGIYLKALEGYEFNETNLASGNIYGIAESGGTALVSFFTGQ